MKMYIVHSDTTKLFYDEQALIKYLGTEKSKRIYYGGKYIPKLDWVKMCANSRSVKQLKSKYWKNQ